MGRKVHPIGFRLGTIEQHRSRWFAEGSEYKDLVNEDRNIRNLVLKSLPEAAISKVEIERFPPNQVRVTVHSAKPGVIIGRRGATVNALRNDLQQMTNKKVKLDAKYDAKLLTTPEKVATLIQPDWKWYNARREDIDARVTRILKG